MALVVDSEMPSATGDSTTASNTRSYSFTNTAGTLLLVSVDAGAGGLTISAIAVTYNSVSMTAVRSIQTGNGGASAVQQFYLKNPATGSNTIAITVTTSGGNCGELISGAISFTGNDTTTPARQSNSTSNNVGGTTASVALPANTVSGNIVVNVMGCGTSVTAGADITTSDTTSWKKAVDNGTGAGNAASGRKAASGGTDSMSWTIPSDIWLMATVEIAAASGTTPQDFEQHTMGRSPIPWNPERSAMAWGITPAIATKPPASGPYKATVLPDFFMRPIWNPERTWIARAGWTQALWAIPPTWKPAPVLPETYLRPNWNPERTETDRAAWTQALWAIPPTKIPEPVLPERRLTPWNPERSAAERPASIQSTWAIPPTKIPEPVLPPGTTRPPWNPERSHSVGIPYLPPTWPTTVVAPERNARPPWDPEKGWQARAGWIQALWAIAPQKIPEPVLPERFVAPWRPQDQQPVWPPFQFSAVVVPVWGYEVLGTQNVAIGWNPERGGLFISGFTQSVPVFGYEVHGPERLMLQWNPGRSEMTRAGWIQSLWAVPPLHWDPLLPDQPYPLIAPDRSALCIPIVVASVPRTTVYAIFVFDD